MALQLAVVWVAPYTLLPPPAVPNQMSVAYRLVYLPVRLALGIGGRRDVLIGPDRKPSPAGSSLILCHPSRHTTAPFPSRSTSDGIVNTPNITINSWPLAPVEARWGIAVHNMGEKKCSVACLDLHHKMSTTLKRAKTPPSFWML
jgi:hypothetical protein